MRILKFKIELQSIRGLQIKRIRQFKKATVKKSREIVDRIENIWTTDIYNPQLFSQIKAIKAFFFQISNFKLSLNPIKYLWSENGRRWSRGRVLREQQLWRRQEGQQLAHLGQRRHHEPQSPDPDQHYKFALLQSKPGGCKGEKMT